MEIALGKLEPDVTKWIEHGPKCNRQGDLTNEDLRYPEELRTRFPILCAIGWLVDNEEDDRNPYTMGMRVGTLPSSLTLPPRTVGDEPRTFSAREVCVLEQIRLQELARHRAALANTCTKWADAFCKVSPAADESDEEIDVEDDKGVTVDVGTVNRQLLCNVNGCISKRNLESKFCLNHLERKRKNFLHREIAKRMFKNTQELYDDFLLDTRRIGAINELLVAPIRRTRTHASAPNSLWRRRLGDTNYEWLAVILGKLFFPYRKVVGGGPGACLEEVWRGQSVHPWCECVDQRKSLRPSVEVGNIRFRCKTCGKVEIGNRPNIRGKERADICFLCNKMISCVQDFSNRVECYCCERCCHNPHDARVPANCSCRKEFETFNSSKGGESIWICSDCRFRIILVQAKHMYQGAKELDAADEEEEGGL
jgi:hypothetical protein